MKRDAPPEVKPDLLRAALRRGGGLCRDPLQSRRLGEVYIMMRFGCDLRCAACSLWGGTGAMHAAGAAGREPRRGRGPDWKALVRQAAALSPAMINFSGGEPLLHYEWLAPALEARRLGIETSLTTNGVHLEQRLPQLCAAVDQINLSLNGPPGISGLVRKGPPGHYARMMRGLRLLAAARRSLGGRAPRLRLMCTVFEGNAGHLAAMIAYLKAEGIEADQYYFQHLIYNTPAELAAHEGELKKMGMRPWFMRGYSLLPGRLDAPALAAELESLAAADRRVTLSAGLKGAALADHYAGRHRWIMPAYCKAPWRDITVLPDGEIWICPDYRIGNFSERPLAEIWNGPEVKALRARLLKRLLPGCRGCFHYYCDKGTGRSAARR